MKIFLDITQQSLMLYPLVLGVYISYKILKITDLTVEGSFVLGSSMFAKLLMEEINPMISMLIAVLSGSLAGVAISTIQKDDKIDSLTAGILMTFILYSINLKIMKVPNLQIYDFTTVMSNFVDFFGLYGELLFLTIIFFLSNLILIILFSTQLGLNLRAYGDNPKLLKKIGKSPHQYKILGLCISNFLAALSGVMTCQIYGFSDVNMGFGIALTAICALLIGEKILNQISSDSKFLIFKDLLSCYLGIVIYYSTITFFLKVGIDPIHLKLLTGLSLIFLLKTIANKSYSNE